MPENGSPPDVKEYLDLYKGVAKRRIGTLPQPDQNVRKDWTTEPTTDANAVQVTSEQKQALGEEFQDRKKLVVDQLRGLRSKVDYLVKNAEKQWEALSQEDKNKYADKDEFVRAQVRPHLEQERGGADTLGQGGGLPTENKGQDEVPLDQPAAVASAQEAKPEPEVDDREPNAIAADFLSQEKGIFSAKPEFPIKDHTLEQIFVPPKYPQAQEIIQLIMIRFKAGDAERLQRLVDLRKDTPDYQPPLDVIRGSGAYALMSALNRGLKMDGHWEEIQTEQLKFAAAFLFSVDAMFNLKDAAGNALGGEARQKQVDFLDKTCIKPASRAIRGELSRRAQAEEQRLRAEQKGKYGYVPSALAYTIESDFTEAMGDKGLKTKRLEIRQTDRGIEIDISRFVYDYNPDRTTILDPSIEKVTTEPIIIPTDSIIFKVLFASDPTRIREVVEQYILGEARREVNQKTIALDKNIPIISGKENPALPKNTDQTTASQADLDKVLIERARVVQTEVERILAESIRNFLVQLLQLEERKNDVAVGGYNATAQLLMTHLLRQDQAVQAKAKKLHLPHGSYIDKEASYYSSGETINKVRGLINIANLDRASDKGEEEIPALGSIEDYVLPVPQRFVELLDTSMDDAGQVKDLLDAEQVSSALQTEIFGDSSMTLRRKGAFPVVGELVGIQQAKDWEAAQEYLKPNGLISKVKRPEQLPRIVTERKMVGLMGFRHEEDVETAASQQARAEAEARNDQLQKDNQAAITEIQQRFPGIRTHLSVDNLRREVSDYQRNLTIKRPVAEQEQRARDEFNKLRQVIVEIPSQIKELGPVFVQMGQIIDADFQPDYSSLENFKASLTGHIKEKIPQLQQKIQAEYTYVITILLKGMPQQPGEKHPLLAELTEDELRALNSRNWNAQGWSTMMALLVAGKLAGGEKIPSLPYDNKTLNDFGTTSAQTFLELGRLLNSPRVDAAADSAPKIEKHRRALAQILVSLRDKQTA